MLKYNGYIPESINEGKGLRSVIFFSGCKHFCKGCHSPNSWDSDYGNDFDLTIQNKIIQDIKNNTLLSGITLCGGEPFLYPLDVLQFIKYIKSEIPTINIWSYSGYTYENLLKNNSTFLLLKEINVLIDGKFEQDKRDLSLKWVGSSNQRIIDVQKSLQENKVILYEM